MQFAFLSLGLFVFIVNSFYVYVQLVLVNARHQPLCQVKSVFSRLGAWLIDQAFLL